ncbi:MAG: hypothetical protein GX770_06140 [Firmicutes bacterium]|nr:hypothetical protein [Bacillota bacterium]
MPNKSGKIIVGFLGMVLDKLRVKDMSEPNRLILCVFMLGVFFSVVARLLGYKDLSFYTLCVGILLLFVYLSFLITFNLRHNFPEATIKTRSKKTKVPQNSINRSS